jgi:acyl carrier protein
MKDRVKKVMVQVFGVSADRLDDDSSKDTVEGWDSVSHLNLVLALEQEFNVQFNDEQIVEMISLELIVEVLKEVRA